MPGWTLSLLTVLAAAATVAFVRNGRLAHGRAPWGWFIMGASAGCGTLALLLIPLEPEAAQWAAAVLGGIAASGAAVGTAVIAVALRGRRVVRDLLDASVLTVTIFFIAWALALHGFLHDRAISDPLALRAAVYPAAWLALGFVMVFCARRSVWPDCFPFMLLGGSLILAGLVTLGRTLLEFIGHPLEGTTGLATWALPLLVAALSGVAPAGSTRAPMAAAGGMTLRSATVPFVGVLVGLAVAILHVASHGHLDTLLFWLGGISFLLVAVREWLAVSDNVRLRGLAERSNQRLQAAMEERQGVLRVLAHDVLGALTPIKIHGYLLAKLGPQAEDKRAESLRTLQRSADNLEHLLIDLRDFARVADNRLDVHPQSCDVADVVRTVVDGFRPEAERLGVRLEFTSPPALFGHADPARMTQVVTNLVRNAIKFTPEGGRIAVTLGLQEGWVRLAVTDSGRGMAADEIPRLFKAFSQTHGAGQAREQGSGLGLFISKGIVDAHRGRIGAESAGLGLGSTFWVEIPQRP